jgi:hypothetical protein
MYRSIYMCSKQNPSEIISFITNLSNKKDKLLIQQQIQYLEKKYKLYLIDLTITINCQVDFIEYLYECGARLTNKALNIASCHGELELLKLLYRLGAEIEFNAVLYASRNMHYKVLDYLYSIKPELFYTKCFGDKLIDEASCISQDITMVKYLISKNIIPTEFSLKYSKSNNDIYFELKKFKT